MYFILFKIVLSILNFIDLYNGRATKIYKIQKDSDHAYIKGKAACAIDMRERMYVFMNPKKHTSLKDVIISAFHEERHLQQEFRYAGYTHMYWVVFSKRGELQYLYNPEELDARRYSNSFGFKSDWAIFEKMNALIGADDLKVVALGKRIEKEESIPLD